jgi:hypothetical protein
MNFALAGEQNEQILRQSKQKIKHCQAGAATFAATTFDRKTMANRCVSESGNKISDEVKCS